MRTTVAPTAEPTARPVLMHPDVQHLLALQADDLELYALEDRLQSLAPRLAALEKERGIVLAQLDRVRASIATEESRHREAGHKVDANRALVERSQRAYESVTSPKEANAAMVQLEQTKRMVDESQRDATQVQGRINELRHQAAEMEQKLSDVETRQSETRAALDAERTSIEQETARAPGGFFRKRRTPPWCAHCATSCCCRSRSAACSPRVAMRPPTRRSDISVRDSINCCRPSSSSIWGAPSIGWCAPFAIARRFW